MSLIAIFLCIHRRFRPTKSLEERPSIAKDIGRQLYELFKTFWNQGSVYWMRGESSFGLLLMGLWLFSVMLVTNHLMGEIGARLAHYREHRFKNVQELVENYQDDPRPLESDLSIHKLKIMVD